MPATPSLWRPDWKLDFFGGPFPDLLTILRVCVTNGSTRQKIFQPMFTTKPVGKGTGLGLSIAHQIIEEKHGGRLCCISTQGKGTQFIIELPVT